MEAAPFRAHVQHAIAAAGVPWPAFAVASGVSVVAVQSLLFGRAGRRVTRLEPHIASRLLRVQTADLIGLRRGQVSADATAVVLRDLLDGGLQPDRLARWCRVSRVEFDRLVDGRAASCSRLTECLAVASERLLEASPDRSHAA